MNKIEKITPISLLIEEIAPWLERPATQRRLDPPKPFSRLSYSIETILEEGRIREEICSDSVSREKLEKILEYRHKTILGDLMARAQYPSPPLKILLTGSTGLIGTALKDFLESQGHLVTPMRHGDNWEISAFEGFDAVIHLAGKNIAEERWSKRVKEKIFRSRCRGTWHLVQMLKRVQSPPKVFLAASAIGYYGDRGAEELDESSKPGTTFLADVCEHWERASLPVEELGIRRVVTRFSLVLSGDGGGLPRMAHPFRFGLGGTIGKGTQYSSWIAIDDVVYGIYHCLLNEKVRGAVNFAAPTAETAASFAKKLADQLHTKVRFQIPEWAIRWGMSEMGEALTLTSCRVKPTSLLESGFAFSYASLEQALAHYL